MKKFKVYKCKGKIKINGYLGNISLRRCAKNNDHTVFNKDIGRLFISVQELITLLDHVSGDFLAKGRK